MSAAPVIAMMDAGQARECVEQIKDHVGEIRKLVLDLHELEGWKALGYNSWRECVVAEFEQSQSRLYQLLDAAKVERNISTIVENADPIPESHLRPLVDLEPTEQAAVYQEAKDTAPNGKITAAHVAAVKEKTVKSWTAPVTSGQADDSENNVTTFGYSGLSPEVTEEQKIVKRFKAFVLRLSEENQISKQQINQYVLNYLTEAEVTTPAYFGAKKDFCEVGWLLLTTERDAAKLALTPSNKDWKESALEFFSELRKRKIVTVS
jgi:hypothetical protein